MKTLVGGLELPDGNLYPSANTVVTLTDAQYALLAPAVFPGLMQDLGVVPVPSSGAAIYPLGAYGFVSASGPMENFTANSTFNNWTVRMFVPGGKAVTAVLVAVNTAGTLGAGGLNGFAVYSDDGTAQLGITPTDNRLWDSVGWRTASLGMPIAAQSADAYVRVVVAVNGYTASPYIPYAVIGASDGLFLNRQSRRTAYLGGLSVFPASFNPATYGTLTNYLPFIGLA